MNINSVNIFFKVLHVIPGNRSSFTAELGGSGADFAIGFSPVVKALVQKWGEHPGLLAGLWGTRASKRWRAPRPPHLLHPAHEHPRGESFWGRCQPGHCRREGAPTRGSGQSSWAARTAPG